MSDLDTLYESLSRDADDAVAWLALADAYEEAGQLLFAEGVRRMRMFSKPKRPKADFIVPFDDEHSAVRFVWAWACLRRARPYNLPVVVWMRLVGDFTCVPDLGKCWDTLRDAVEAYCKASAKRPKRKSS